MKGQKVCLAHADEQTRASVGFGGREAGAMGGRPPAPRAVDVLRERLEANIDRVLAPMFAALEAEMVITVGDGMGAEHMESLIDHNTRMRAAQLILDRVHGRPRQTTDVHLEKRELSVRVDLTGEDARDALSTLLRQRPALPE